ncbi:MAG: DNA-binding response regulator [Bacteroidota bacterium]|nr:DNA-binding response regulator [Bacteroidota bacterium]
MLTIDISNIIGFVQAKGLNPSEPTDALKLRLVAAESISKTHILIYNFESSRLFFANSSAASFLGITKVDVNKEEDTFLESILHPISYQLLLYNTRLHKQQTEFFDGVFYLKTHGKGKYAWVYASARVMDFNACGVPKLIYISFVEIEKAIECYGKILYGGSTSSEYPAPLELMGSLSTREIELLSLIASEWTSKEIANKLNITQSAVDAARKRLIKKLKVKSVVGLVKVALSLGLSGNSHPPLNQRTLERDIRSLLSAHNPVSRPSLKA